MSRHYPEAIAEALSRLRLVGVNGPYCVVPVADAYTASTRSSDQATVIDIFQEADRREIICWAHGRSPGLSSHDRRGGISTSMSARTFDRLSQPHRQGGSPLSPGRVPSCCYHRGGVALARREAERDELRAA